MRRPQLVGALVAAVIALVASVAVAVGARSGPSSWSTRGQGQWSGMSGGYGQGQGAGISAGSMMGSMGMMWLAGDGVAVSGIPAARARAATAAAPAGLHPGEVMWFDNGFYVEFKDVAGQPATEVIVDPRTGAVSTEPGPAMMWNTRFGMMRAGSNSAGLVTSTKARAIAASWLAANQAGTTIGSIDAYPGYFTIDLHRGGVVSGMMSVSSVTGAVWYHVWHGAFIAMEDS
ncbi:MAG: hypothetical protein ACYDC9_11845 [Dermatophilaceae bacterium]